MRDHIAIGIAIDLFGAGERGLIGAVFGSVEGFAMAVAHFDQLVNGGKRGCIGRSRELGANAKGIDGNTGFDQIRQRGIRSS